SINTKKSGPIVSLDVMKKYKVFLNGRNFLMEADGQPKKMGFYTTRFVEAETPENAENIAVELVRNDAELRKAVKNEKPDPPTIYAEEIALLQSFEGILVPGTGYTFYEEECEGKA